MRNYDEIFDTLPQYVGANWWQEHFAEKFEGTMNGPFDNISSAALKTLAKEMKEGLERASAEAVEFIDSADTKGNITKWFKISSNLTLDLYPHINIVRLTLNYYHSSNKWAVEIIGGDMELGYQSCCTIIYSYENVIRDFLASDEFIVVCMHQLGVCNKDLEICKMECRRW